MRTLELKIEIVKVLQIFIANILPTLTSLSVTFLAAYESGIDSFVVSYELMFFASICSLINYPGFYQRVVLKGILNKKFLNQVQTLIIARSIASSIIVPLCFAIYLNSTPLFDLLILFLLGIQFSIRSPHLYRMRRAKMYGVELKIKFIRSILTLISIAFLLLFLQVDYKYLFFSILFFSEIFETLIPYIFVSRFYRPTFKIDSTELKYFLSTLLSNTSRFLFQWSGFFIITGEDRDILMGIIYLFQRFLSPFATHLNNTSSIYCMSLMSGSLSRFKENFNDIYKKIILISSVPYLSCLILWCLFSYFSIVPVPKIFIYNPALEPININVLVLTIFMTGVGLHIEVTKKLEDQSYLNVISISRLGWMFVLYLSYETFGIYGYTVGIAVLNILIYAVFVYWFKLLFNPNLKKIYFLVLGAHSLNTGILIFLL